MYFSKLMSTASGVAPAASWVCWSARTGSSPSVCCFQNASTSRAGTHSHPERDRLAPAACERIGEHHSEAQEQVRRLQPTRRAEQETGESGVGDPVPGESERVTKNAAARTTTMDG